MGVIFMVMGICSSLTQGLLVGRVIKKLGEPRTIQIGLMGTAATFLFYPLIFNFTSALVIIIGMGVVSSFLRPALNSFVSKRADPSEQGTILGVVNSYYSLGRVAGPILGGLIFDYMGMSWPYLSASLIFFLAYGLSFILLSRKKKVKPHALPHAAND
jgi:DHA1 family multidrug resistance protein-like MFS transporter